MLNINKEDKHKIFIQRVYDIVKDEYTVLGIYSGIHDKVKIKHNLCGNIWDIEPNSFINANHRCPKCQAKIRAIHKSTDIVEFLDKLNNIFPNEFEVIGKYINLTTKVEILHKPCNTSRLVLPDSLLRGRRCPLCASLQDKGYKFNKTHSDFVKIINDVYKDEYDILSEYKNMKSKILVVHKSCGFEWSVNPDNFIRGHGCPKCSSNSIGENKIEKFLSKKDITYYFQQRFLDCRDKNPLPFDFGIPYEDGSWLLIEYHGKQHYESVDFAGRGEKWAKEQLKDQKKKDKIKLKYCQDNNMSLLIIPYWQFDNIEKILADNLL